MQQLKKNHQVNACNSDMFNQHNGTDSTRVKQCLSQWEGESTLQSRCSSWLSVQGNSMYCTGCIALLCTFLGPLFPATAIREATEMQMELKVCDTSITYFMLWAGKQVTRRILLSAILKWVDESKSWNLYNS